MNQTDVSDPIEQNVADNASKNVALKKPRGMIKTRLDLPAERIVELFQNGASSLALSLEFGCSRQAIDRRLRGAGINPRSVSASQQLRADRLTKSQRQQFSAAAHAALRGKRYTPEELCHRARSRQQSFDPKTLKGHERRFYEMATFPVVPQFATGKYNADFLIAGTPITVEIFGGKWHAYGRHRSRFASRSECIRNANLVCVIVWCIDYTIERGCIDYIHALADESRREESLLREQHVIGSDGKPTAFGGDKLNYLTGVMRFHKGQYIARDDD